MRSCRSVRMNAPFTQIEAGTWYAPGTTKRRQATQYFEVVGHHCGKWVTLAPLAALILYENHPPPCGTSVCIPRPLPGAGFCTVIYRQAC